MKMSTALPIISLFSGAGGLDLGFEKAGFNIATAVDVFPAAVATHNRNRKHKIAIVGDLLEIGGESISRLVLSDGNPANPLGVIAGPPCQAFSHSNVYPKKDDVRRTLPGRFARILGELNSLFDLDFFVFENVRGLTFERHQEEFAGFRFLFEEAGFNLVEGFLNAKDFGVPQDRPRVFIVGFNKRLGGSHDFKFPQPTSTTPVTVREAFGKAFGPEPWPKPALFQRGMRPENIPYHPNHWTMMPKSPKFKNGQLKEGEVKGRSFRLLSWDRPSWTVAYGHREIHVHPSGRRRLSIFEAMLLQGFPEEYVLEGNLSDQVKLVSDSVPPPLACHLAKAIRAAIERTYGA